MDKVAVAVLVVFVVTMLALSFRVIREQRVGLVERMGEYRRRLDPGPHFLFPFLDRVRFMLDVREEVVPFPPQGVITEDNLMVSIDSVIYFEIIDPVRAAYEAQNYRWAIEQLTMTTLRNIIGGMDLERALTSREEINHKLRTVLDGATGKWGIKVNRVELRAIDPPATIRDAMEKGARAEREKRAQILLAEGQRQSQILQADGDRESSILRAQGDREAAVLRAQADRQAQMLRAEGEAQSITTVFSAIHAGEPDQALLAYQYMQMLPKLASGDSNKVWVVPSELNDALKGLGQASGAEDVREYVSRASKNFTGPERVDVHAEIEEQAARDRARSRETVQQAIEEAAALDSSTPGRRQGSASWPRPTEELGGPAGGSSPVPPSSQPQPGSQGSPEPGQP